MDEPYLRFCVPCDAIHLYEQPFRLAALRAGLELQPGTSPPVLQPVPGLAPAPTRCPNGSTSSAATCACSGPATPKLVAGYLDAPVKDVQARWPDDAVEVAVDGERAGCWPRTPTGCRGGPPASTRLLGPFDLFLQARDRSLLVARPGAREGPVADARPARRRAGPTARSSARGGRASPARR